MTHLGNPPPTLGPRAGFVHGVNLAWWNYGSDFGGGSSNGASSTATQAGLVPWFAKIQAAGMTVVRWWVFPDASQITTHFTLDGSGNPSGFSTNFYHDLEAAFTLATTYGVRLQLTLFNHPIDIPAAWRDTGNGRVCLVNALASLASQYKSSPVFAWELGNEWDNQLDPFNPTVGVNRANCLSLISQFTAAIHATGTTAYATVSNGGATTLDFFVGLGLDFYATSWYAGGGRVDDYNVLLHNYAYYANKYGIDKPLVINEFQANTTDPALAYMNYFNTNGYSGSLGWSATPAALDGYRIDFTGAATSFAATARNISSNLRAPQPPPLTA